VCDGERRRAIVEAVRVASESLARTIAASPHAEEFGSYGDLFWQPIASAAAIVVPCARRMPDTLANLVRSAGANPDAMQLPSAMPMEVCATSAGVMALMLQAHAEGVGACWMAGPMVAADEIEALVELRPRGTPREPHGFRMLGAIALGYPDETQATKPSRKPIDQVVRYL